MIKKFLIKKIRKSYFFYSFETQISDVKESKDNERNYDDDNDDSCKYKKDFNFNSIELTK